MVARALSPVISSAMSAISERRSVFRAASGEAATTRFVRVQDAAGRTLAAAQEGDAGIGGVALEVAGRRQEAQWPARGILCLLRVGLPVRHRREALGSQLPGIEFEPARGRAKLLSPRRREADRPTGAHLVGIERGDRAL